jgi:quinolinate synthase
MFSLTAEAAREDRGVVGSTSNILHFIGDRVDAAIAEARPAELPFVLATEAGMVTAIVRAVRKRLHDAGRSDIAVDIIFPVASEAVAATGEADLALVPGVLGGEGCTPAGGCATCPYMKMNSLDALIGVLEHVNAGETEALKPYAPRSYDEKIAGRTAADLGSEPILHMRHLQRTGRLSEELVEEIVSR